MNIIRKVEAIGARVFPSWNRRGGRAIKKMRRSLLSWRGRGGQFSETLRVSDHPVCAASERELFINGAATPPVPGGEHARPHVLLLSALLISLAAISTMQAMQVEKDNVERMLNDGDCHSCHSIDHTIVGPSYTEVAKKYATRADAAEQLTRTIRQGGSGNWGDLRMPPHPDLNEAQLAEIARWILSLKDVAPGQAREAKPKDYIYTVSGKTVTLNFPIFVEGNDQTVTKNVFHGYQLYNSYCYRCHGTDATESELAPDLRRFVAGNTPKEFLSVAMAGREDKGMPMWAGFFSEEEIQQIYEYVKGRSLELVPTGRPRSEFDSGKN